MMQLLPCLQRGPEITWEQICHIIFGVSLSCTNAPGEGKQNECMLCSALKKGANIARFFCLASAWPSRILSIEIQGGVREGLEEVKEKEMWGELSFYFIYASNPGRK